MPLPRFEVAVGPVDGVNTIFRVSTAYLPGTLAPFLNGQLKRADYDDGWTEADPPTGEFKLNEPPLVGDDVQAFFLDTSPVLVSETVTALLGVLSDSDDLVGGLSLSTDVSAILSDEDALEGVLVEEIDMTAGLVETDDLVGTLREVC